MSTDPILVTVSFQDSNKVTTRPLYCKSFHLVIHSVSVGEFFEIKTFLFISPSIKQGWDTHVYVHMYVEEIISFSTY